MNILNLPNWEVIELKESEYDYAFYYSGISWLIIGQQTPVSPKTSPKIEWIKEIVDAADKASIPVFLKNNLLELVNYESPETNFAFNKTGEYSQEFPNL
jgi:hypothetical protein